MESLLGLDPAILVGKYWTTLSSNFSDVYLLSVAICIVVAIVTVGYTSKRQQAAAVNESKGGGAFDISPEDEVTFKSLLTEEEVNLEKEKRAKSKYQQLDLNSPTAHIQRFLQNLPPSESDSDDDDTMSEEEDEIGSASSLMSRVKLARQEALRKKLESEMTENDKLKEKMIQQQQLAKIFSLLTENKDSFGDVSFDDVKKQMNMYSGVK